MKWLPWQVSLADRFDINVSATSHRTVRIRRQPHLCQYASLPSPEFGHSGLTQVAREAFNKASDVFVDVVRGQAVAMSVLVLLLAVTCWKLREQAWLPVFLRNVWSRGGGMLGSLLIWAALASVTTGKAMVNPNHAVEFDRLCQAAA